MNENKFNDEYIPPIGYILTNLYSKRTLPCDGRELSREEYKNLFNVIGIDFGRGDGVTTFNLLPPFVSYCSILYIVSDISYPYFFFLIRAWQ